MFQCLNQQISVNIPLLSFSLSKFFIVRLDVGIDHNSMNGRALRICTKVDNKRNDGWNQKPYSQSDPAPGPNNFRRFSFFQYQIKNQIIDIRSEEHTSE